MSKQSEFFEDTNRDGVADGLQVDRNADGRPDFMEKYLKRTESRLFWTAVLALIGATVIPAVVGLAVDYIGHLFGWH